MHGSHGDGCAAEKARIPTGLVSSFYFRKSLSKTLLFADADVEADAIASRCRDALGIPGVWPCCDCEKS